MPATCCTATAAAPATTTGSVARCGLNRTVPARAACSTPSPNWADSRVASSRRKSARASSERTVVPACRTRSPYGGLPSPQGGRRAEGPFPSGRVPPAGRRSCGAHWRAMTPPSSPDPESGPPARPATGRRRSDPVPALSTGTLDDVRPGSLLVAMPGLTDPTFAGTVVFVLDHNDSGTLGVVLGRPSQVEIRDVLPGWCDLAVDPGVFHVGGPCETDTALCLAVCGAPDEDCGLRRGGGGAPLVGPGADPPAPGGPGPGLGG